MIGPSSARKASLCVSPILMFNIDFVICSTSSFTRLAFRVRVRARVTVRVRVKVKVRVKVRVRIRVRVILQALSSGLH